MRGVVLIFCLFVWSGLSVKRCSWCSGTLDVDKARRKAKEIIQMKVRRTAQLESKNNVRWTLSVDRSKTRSYKLGQEFK
jgi:hypothetical protein